MGAGPSAKAWLRRPEEASRLPAKVEQRITEGNLLEEVFRRVSGKIRFRTSTWSQLSDFVRSRQADVASALQEEFLSEDASELELTQVELDVLTGRFNYQERREARGWLGFLPSMEPRVTWGMDHDGHVRSTTVVNIGDEFRLHAPAVPSLEQLGLAAQLTELQCAEQDGACEYTLRLSHTYTATMLRPPHGTVSWESELVVLRFRLEAKAVLVVQVSGSAPGADGLAAIRCSNLAGEELLYMRLDPTEARVAELLAPLAEQCRRGTRRLELRLVFPGGTTAGTREASALLADVWPALSSATLGVEARGAAS